MRFLSPGRLSTDSAVAFAVLVLVASFLLLGGCAGPERTEGRAAPLSSPPEDSRPGPAAPAADSQSPGAREPDADTEAPRVPDDDDWDRLMRRSRDRETLASPSGDEARPPPRRPPSARSAKRDPLLDVLDDGSDPPARPRRSKLSRTAEDLLERLRSGPPEDREAFLEITRAPRRLLAELIPHVGSTEPTKFYEIDAPALHDSIVRADDEERLYYYVKGMGRFYFDDVATGPLRSGRGVRVEFRSFERPFSLGVVLRAALLYRFASEAYPDFPDEERDIVRWWREYYERSEAKL